MFFPDATVKFKGTKHGLCLETRTEAETDLSLKLLFRIINSNIVSFQFQITLPFDGAPDTVRNEKSDACVYTYFRLIFCFKIKKLQFIYSMLGFF